VALNCGLERTFKLIGMFHFQELKPNRQGLGRGLYLFDLALGADNAWIPQNSHERKFGDDFLHQLQSFAGQVARQTGKPCDVSAWPCQARDEAKGNRVIT